MTAFWVAVSIAVVVVWAFTVVDLFSRHLDRPRMLAWLLMIILLPFAGALVYWVVRRRELQGTKTP